MIALIDLDATNETITEALHYLGGNFELGPVDDSGFGQLTNTTAALAEYTQPSLDAGSGPSR